MISVGQKKEDEKKEYVCLRVYVRGELLLSRYSSNI